MSRAIQPTSEITSTEAESAEEEFVWPDFNPSSGYREFIERLRRARIERGLSIADMSDEVGLSFKLAYEFETCAAPLPFDYLEVWCQVVGVPFEDFLAIYWADQREWQERQDAQEAQEVEEQAPCITSTEAGETQTLVSEAPAPTSDNRGFSFLATLRAALDRIARFFRALFSTK